MRIDVQPVAGRRALALLPLLLVAACATHQAPAARVAPPPTDPAVVGELRPGFIKGYLPFDALPDSAALLKPPPTSDAAMSRDKAAYQAAVAATPERWALAARDADLAWPAVAQSFGTVLGVTIDSATAPNLSMLLRRSMADAGVATQAAKRKHSRTRPFVAMNSQSCSPQDEAFLRTDGSYPSGHAAIGWMLALVLVELAPDRQNPLLARGFDFGESRVICRVHWESDVEAGRLVASATYARLQADPTFRAQAGLAAGELKALRASAGAAGMTAVSAAE
jgi:acid phosphatase (class A)